MKSYILILVISLFVSSNFINSEDLLIENIQESNNIIEQTDEAIKEEVKEPEIKENQEPQEAQVTEVKDTEEDVDKIKEEAKEEVKKEEKEMEKEIEKETIIPNAEEPKISEPSDINIEPNEKEDKDLVINQTDANEEKIEDKTEKVETENKIENIEAEKKDTEESANYGIYSFLTILFFGFIAYMGYIIVLSYKKYDFLNGDLNREMHYELLPDSVI